MQSPAVHGCHQMVGCRRLASGQELYPTKGRWGASLVFLLQGKFGGLNNPFFGGGFVVGLHTRILRRGWGVEGGPFSLWAALEEILSIGLPRCFVWVCRWIGIHLGHVFLGDQRADPVGVYFRGGSLFPEARS